MALFSDIDWIIVLAVGAFLLLGRGSGETMRTFGRWYGRALRMKHELLSEVARATDLPVGAIGGSAGIRTTLLGLDPEVAATSRIPTAVPRWPEPRPPLPAPNDPWTGGSPTLSWSVTGGAPAEGWH